MRVIKSAEHLLSTQSYTYKWGKLTVKSQGSAWSPWLDFTPADVRTALHGYSSSYLRRFPAIIRLQVSPVVDPTSVNIQVRFSGTAREANLSADLFGPSLALMIWRDVNSNAPRAETMAGYNQRYWAEFDRAAIPPSQRPKRFLIVDRFIGGDDDILDWQQGISHLAEVGITAMLVPPLGPLPGMLTKDGVGRVALAVYSPPGGALGGGTKTQPLDKWASELAAEYLKAGYSPSDFSIIAIADEPGWYFPMVLEAVKGDPTSLDEFRSYMAQQHLTPTMLGAANWSQVYPVGHGGVSTSAPLSRRRLFYWTCRFFSWKSAQYMRSATAQLHRAFTPELKTFSDFNNFADQFYFEGFAANNPSPHNPDAAMGAPDWFEFGQMHGADLMWTEDWFANNRAYQWSYYAAKFASIGYQNGLGFGGYVIGRVDGDPPDGLTQRILALVGNGAKAVFYYNFGPAYNWPGNCYSEVPGVPTQLGRADSMIAKSENILWPGRKPQAQVAILEPRSSEVWDGLSLPPGGAVVGATNNNPNAATLDYMAEEYDEYLALEMSDIPVDFIDEDELTDATLDHYKVLYVTEPDVPNSGQRAVTRWVKAGGTLVMVPGAAQGDRYDEPAKTLTLLTGSLSHERAYVRNALSLKQVATVGGEPVFGEPPDPPRGGTVLLTFDDHMPAITQHDVDRGHILTFSWFPGIAYAHLALGPHLELLDNAAANSLRELVLKPVRSAGVSPPVQVNIPYVESPILESPEGDAITLLNWTGRDLSSIKVRVRVPFRIRQVVSVTRGNISLQRQGDGVTFSLPLGAADIVELRR